MRVVLMTGTFQQGGNRLSVYFEDRRSNLIRRQLFGAF